MTSTSHKVSPKPYPCWPWRMTFPSIPRETPDILGRTISDPTFSGPQATLVGNTSDGHLGNDYSCYTTIESVYFHRRVAKALTAPKICLHQLRQRIDRHFTC